MCTAQKTKASYNIRLTSRRSWPIWTSHLSLVTLSCTPPKKWRHAGWDAIFLFISALSGLKNQGIVTPLLKRDAIIRQPQSKRYFQFWSKWLLNSCCIRLTSMAIVIVHHQHVSENSLKSQWYRNWKKIYREKFVV